jgi:hypothetical protein
VIQISPSIESPQSSATEAIHTPGPAKKEGLGVFAKILAGLLRKTGEKDAVSAFPAAGDPADLPGLTTAESSDTGDMSVRSPGRRGTVRGKKPAGDGTFEPGLAGVLRGQGTKHAPADLAGVSPDQEAGPDGVLAEGFINRLFRGNPAEPAGVDDGGDAPAPKDVKVPAKAVLPADNGEVAAGEEPVFPFGIPGSGGLPDITEFEGAETGEARRGRKKAGDKPLYADSPEEKFSARQHEDNPGLFPGGFRPGGSGEKNRAEPHTRLSEARQKEKRRDRIVLEVQDFRTGSDQSAGNISSPGPGADAARFPAGRGETEILVELRGENPGRETPQAADQSWESRAGRSFEDFLARELHQNLNGDIVRHASVALRDGGEGSIRLSLRPESLGNVKIRLEMADNKVTGHIVVESEAALRAFEREVSSLEQAFRDSGFDAADLDMSLTQSGGGMERGWGEEADRPSVPEHLAALRYDAASERMEPPDFAPAEAPRGVFTRNGRIAVNMLI